MHDRSQFRPLHLLLLSLAIFLTLGPTFLRAADSAQSELDAVWQRVQRSGAYAFSADMVQTDTPRATIRNAGRQGQVSTYFMQGETDLVTESLRLRIWSDGGSALLPDSGMELAVEETRARARQGDGAWQEIEDFTGLFAPGGDFFSYSRMAKNEVRHDPELLDTVAGQVAVTRFTFELDGRAYAIQMAEQMREQAVREGLPATMRFELPTVYKEMTGTGELWVGQDGLPLRQILAMNFPETQESQISSVAVTVDFSDFAPSAFGHGAGWQRWAPPWIGRAATGIATGLATGIVLPESWLTLALIVLTLAGTALVVIHRRSRPVYAAVVVAVIGSMVAVPLLNGHQIHAYEIRQQAKQEKREATREEGDAAQKIREAMHTTDFDPNRAPLETAQEKAAYAEAALAVVQQDEDDESDDGRYFEDSCEIDPHGDDDGDTLTNLEECLLGTLTTVADTDNDGLNDNVEVTGFSYGGQIWYTNPLELDSNKDGLGDGQEWLLDIDEDGVPDDTDGDGTPDLWDEDNDGDGASDELDLSVYVHTGGGTAAQIGETRLFDEETPLQIQFNNLHAGELINVEFQLTPSNPEHLWYTRNVLDWPMNDRQGQIQDADGATFFDLDNSLEPSPNANGDMRMVPMIEIQMPLDSANLPPAQSCTTEADETTTCYPLLEQFGISIQQTSETTLAAYVPLQVVSDDGGDKKVGFYGRMLYQASGLWQDAHDVRLVWAIQALNDICEEFKDHICQSYSDYNVLQIVQTYYDEWSLTGLMLTEEHSAEIALIYEDPAVVDANAEPDAFGTPLYLDNLYQLLYGLDFSFLAGRDCDSVDADGDCVGNGQRDVTVDEIARRFDHATNGNVSDEERWGTPNVFSVVTNEYESLDLGAMETAITQTVQILDDAFTEQWSASAPVTPTIMMATEHSYRAFNFDQIISDPTNLRWNANGLTIDLAQSGDHAVELETMASLKWTPYAYDPVDGWAAAEISDFWDTLTVLLGDRFDGLNEDLDDPDAADTYHTMSQVLYLTLYQGTSYVVQTADRIQAQIYQSPDVEIENSIAVSAGKALQVIIGTYFKYAEGLKIAAEQIRNRASFDYIWRFDTASQRYKANEIALYGGTLFAVAFYAFVIVAAALLVTSLVFKYIVQDTWSGWDTIGQAATLTLMVLFLVLSPILKVLQMARWAVSAGEFASLGSAFWSKLTTIKKVNSAGRTIAIIGLIITITIAVGVFIWAWATGKVSPGEVAFNQLIAQTIAAIIIAVLIFALSLTVVGAILVAIISIVDLILQLAGSDFTIMGSFADALAGMFYRFNLGVNYTVNTGAMQLEMTDPDLGFVAENQIAVSLPITTQLRAVSSKRLLAHSLVYELYDSKRALEARLGEREDDYTVRIEEPIPGVYPWPRYLAEVVDEPSYSGSLQPGINQKTVLYLNSGYAFQGRECWLVVFCSNRTIGGSTSEELGNISVIDVLPSTLDDFVRVAEWGEGGGLRFLDPDGDGLLAHRAGGLDPDNSTWDSDGDGLSDWYELYFRSRSAEEGGINLDPQSSDSDGDGVPDATEITLGSNPGRADSDGDGLTDAEELGPGGGWDLPYRYDSASGTVTTTRAWSSPLQADADGDGLSDLFERTRLFCPTCTPWADPDNPVVYNPNVWNQSPVALYVDDDTIDGFVSPGETVVYTTTTENNLGSGQELLGELSLDAPEGVSGGPFERDVEIDNGESAALVSNLSFASPDSATYDFTSRTQLTNFFETRWAWDAPGVVENGVRNNSVEAIAVESLDGWNGSHLVVTREPAQFSDAIAAYVVNSDGTILASTQVAPAAPDFRYTDPDVACNGAGVCVVMWGFYDNSGQLPPVIQGRQFNGALSNTKGVNFGDLSSQTHQIRNVAVASNGTDFMATWASNTTQSTGNTQVYYAPISVATGAGARQILIGNASGAQAATVAWTGTEYTLAWTESSSIRWRSVDPEGTLPDDTIYSVAGGGWPRSDGNKRPPTLSHDEISGQTLLAYRSSAGELVARLVSAGPGDPFTLVSEGVDGSDVTVALAADRENGGWIAAWTPAGGGRAEYLAIAPSGTLRGEMQGFDQVALTTVALACRRPRSLLELSFNEEAGATVFADASGNGHDAVCDGTCPQSGTEGVAGNAVSFNGADQALRVDDISLTDSSFTISTWARVSDLDSSPKVMMSIGDYNSNANIPTNALSLLALNNRIYCSIIKVGSIFTEPVIEAGKWYHWACTYDKKSGRITLYQDGDVVASSTFTKGYIGNDTLWIGRIYGTASPDYGQFFNGSLDSLMVVDRALSATEIREMAVRAAAAYSLDEPPGAELFVNAVSSGPNGHCESSATCPTLGVPGAAYTAAEFDGQDDHIVIGDENASLSLASSSLTVSAWVKRNSSDTHDFVFSQGTGATYAGFSLGFLADNRLRCGPWGDVVTTTASYTDTEWRHVACTFDVDTRQLRLYYQGAEVASKTTSGLFTGSGPVYIGQRLDDQRHFFGAIDEVGVWQTALTAAQIQALFEKVKVVDETVLVCQLPAATGDAWTFNQLVLRQTTTELGEINQSIDRSITVDSDLPLASPSSAYFAQNDTGEYVRSPHSLVVAGTATDPSSYVTAVGIQAGGNWEPAVGTETWLYTWNTTGLSDGPQTLQLRATDAVGNVSAASSWTTILDNTPPDTTIQAPDGAVRPTQTANGQWSVSLRGSASDPAAGALPGSGVVAVEVLLQGTEEATGLGWQPATLSQDGTWQIDYGLGAYDSPDGSAIGASGIYSVSVRATDAVSNTSTSATGNTSAAGSAPVLLTVDAAGPLVAPSEALSNTIRITTTGTVAGTLTDDHTVTAVEVNWTPGEQIGALNGVVFHQPFDEHHATAYFADQSGASNHATCAGNQCPLPEPEGQRGEAVRFDGSNAYLSAPALLDPATTPFSAAAWFQVDALGAPQYILQQLDGVGTGRTWLALTATGEVHTFLGGSGFNSNSRIAAGAWHHAAVTYDGTTLTLYVDGVLDNSTVRSIEPSTGAMRIGANKVPNIFYDGLLDEMVIYNRALAEYEVANLYAYGQGIWSQATLEGDTWRYAIPTGAENGLEGIYQLNVRGVDALGNVTPQGGQRVWRGEIDTRPPRLTFTVDADTSGNTTTSTYTCTATDFNLVEESTCLPGQTPDIPTFRDSDATLTSYDEEDPWYAANITDTARLYAMDARRTYPADPITGQTMTACDAYGRCSQVAAGLLPTALYLLDAEILEPSGGTVLTTTAPVTVSGEVYAADGLREMAVDLNGITVHTQEWESAETTVAAWHFQWTPPGEGIYRFEPLVDSWAGETPPVRGAWDQPVVAQPDPAVQQRERRSVTPPDQLTDRIYLPWAASGGSSTGELSTDGRIYLPLVATEGALVTGAFTGTITTLYVDLTPPTVAIDATVLSSTHALENSVVRLTGRAADSVGLHRVDVRIDGGPWQRAGLTEASDGSYVWEWLWWPDGVRPDSALDSQSVTVSARAEDLAGRTATITETVRVDVVAPVPGDITLEYVTGSGEQISVEPGAVLNEAGALAVRWDAGSDGGGPIHYEVGFSPDVTPGPAELTRYAEAGTHQAPVSDGQRLYATVRYVDAVGNESVITLGPVQIASSHK